MVSRDLCAMIGIVCWGLWNRRNKWVWERANGSAFGVKSGALNLLADWRKAQETRSSHTGSSVSGAQRWCRPPAG